MASFRLSSMHVLVALALLLTTLSLASSPPELQAPGLSYLYTVNITGGPVTVIGPGPRGTRLVVPIVGGTFTGPKLNGNLANPPPPDPFSNPKLTKYPQGTVLPLGGDWPLIDANNPNGTVALDVRQTFATDDGAFIQVFETGAPQPDVAGHVRLAFETGSEKYYWLNAVVGVGILRIGGDGTISIDAWQVSCGLSRSRTESGC